MGQNRGGGGGGGGKGKKKYACVQPLFVWQRHTLDRQGL